ncbi:hypothetical protein C8R43DRAFT_1239673 [Mycena crocata]|nr:hypothetical protein C8R43DRAFT_1239673 [Mycena crocata]
MVFIPLLSKPRRRSTKGSQLSRRRGGGASGGKGGGGGGKGGGKSGGTTNKGGGSNSSGKSGGKTSSITTGGTGKSITSYNNGGGKASVISSGNAFAGRSQGGASRSQIYGSRTYGSGYPGYYGRGVAGRGFPFYFWPLAWGTGIGYGSNSAYMHSNEYGARDNSSRPGGVLSTASFQSNSTGTIFRVVSDNSTVADLMGDIATNCSMYLVPAATNATTPFNDASQQPAPEQVVQYYRASSVALSLDGYNNSAVFAAENSTADTPLPAGIDTKLLDCLNYTVGLAAPLVDGAQMMQVPRVGVSVLVVLVLRSFM